jgi:hypothetical protein
MAPANPRISPVWLALNPSPPAVGVALRYCGSSSSHRPHTAYCRNIITASTGEFFENIPTGSAWRAS